MELNLKLTYSIPEELIDALGITDDTVFCTYYSDGKLIVETVDEDEVEMFDDDIENFSEKTTDSYHLGYEDGYRDGYQATIHDITPSSEFYDKKVCGQCGGKVKPKEATLLDVINSLSESEQKAVFNYLSKRISTEEDF